MFNLRGRVAVITGASSGLGRQMAEGFASQGADLVLLARRVDKLEEAKDELAKYNAKATFFCCGKNMVKKRLLLDRIAAEGHVIANHTFSHISYKKY